MEMHPKTTTLEKIFEGIDTKYLVPEYQRNYSWTPTETEDLWRDIISAYETGSKYFLGTYVLTETDQEEVFDIVDGQQRLATFSILFSVIAAIGNDFQNNDEVFAKVTRTSANSALARKMSNVAMDRLRHNSEPDNFFLDLNKKDKEVFNRVVRETEKTISTDQLKNTPRNAPRIIKNQKLFYELIYDKFIGETALQDLYNALIHFIKKLQFISIVVEDDADAFLLFESLNSKGMDLSVADLVKNKLLMQWKRVSNDSDPEEIITFWDEMIAHIGDSKLNPVDFLRIYWEAIENKNRPNKDLYRSISNKINAGDTDIKVFARDLNEKAGSVSELFSKENDFPVSEVNSNSLKKICGEINHLGYSLCRPALLYAYHERPDLLTELASNSLSYLFRWVTIGDFSVGTAKSVFNNLIAAMREGASKDEVIRTFRDENYNRINDESFSRAIKELRVENNRIAKYILSKIEIRLSKETIIPNYSSVQLEHILPQNPEKWEEDGFQTAPGIKIEDWIYHIGNMTLLRGVENLKGSNHLFSKKQEFYSGESPFILTDRVFSGKEIVEWTTEGIVDRAEEISKIVPEIWSL